MRTALFVLAAATVAGCTNETPTRPRFAGDTVQMRLGEKTLTVEVACDIGSRRRGLMHRERLPEMHGMLFIFPAKVSQSFWMKNTLIPLSIAFLDDEGTILQIEDMRPKDESKTKSKHKVRFALEVNKGWFRKHRVGIGSRIEGFAMHVAKFRTR